MNINLNNQMEDIHDLILLNIRETLTQKRIKKILFIIISIIYPSVEIIFIVFQIMNSFKEGNKDYDDNNILSPIRIFLGLFSLGSLFCTWGMVSVCYLEKNCLRTLIFIKITFTIINFLILTQFNNFDYFLVYGTLIFGSFITLIIVYKVFPKGII